ncbi:hypothetical protein ACSBR2_024010 [Camellia fascicularis]
MIGGVSDGEFFFNAADVHYFGGVRLWQASRVFFDANDAYSGDDRLWQASRDVFAVQRRRIASFTSACLCPRKFQVLLCGEALLV